MLERHHRRLSCRTAAPAPCRILPARLTTPAPSPPSVPARPLSPRAVTKGSGVFLVEFYAPWCGHCKNLVPAWKQAATALKGIVNVVAVDATAAQGLASKYGVQGFPTIKLFIGGDAKATPIDYNGARDAQAIVSWAMGQAQTVARTRLGGKAGGSSSSGGGGGKKAGGGSGKASSSEPGGGKAVVTLTEDNFDELVLKSRDPWMVEFYAPWCGHCKTLAPEWADAADQAAADGVKFGAVDATAHQSLATRFGVRGYPTIKTFAGGAKNGDDAARDYNGGRTAADLVAAAAKLGEASGVAPPVDQLTSQAQFDEACSGKRICLLAVLPHILDDKAAGRSARISALKDAAAKRRGAPLRFLWTEVGAQPALEAAMAVGLTPALYAVATEKKAYTVHRGAFDATAIAAFAGGLTTNKGASGAVPFPPSMDLKTAVAPAKAWDGKDATLDTADEISLDDLEDL
jgi:protein disulfide-isomerase A6